MGESGSQSHTPPALNKFMHPRNPYRTPPSFKLLATLYPNFRHYCSYDVEGKVRLDFSQPRALAELAIALMHKDFGLMVELPSTHLVPTIPLRLNYLLWLQDIVGLWAHRVKTEAQFDLKEALQLQQQQKQQYDQEQQQQKENCADSKKEGEIKKNDASHKPPQYTSPVIGLDIGSGASCVYGLLGARQCGWHMLATDTDADSLAAAAANVASNNMQHSVHVTQGSSSSLFGALEKADVLQFLSKVRHSSITVPAATHADDEPMEVDSDSNSYVCDSSGYLLDFSMCNPPFFSSEQDTDSCSKNKKQRGPPNNAYTGTVHETVVDGGELAFIAKMVEESIAYKHKIRVFSTLVGTAADVKKVKQLVAAAAPLHSTVTEFCQGRTMRWGVAWSWSTSAPLSRVLSKKQSSTVKPLILAWPRASCLPVYTVTAAWEAITGWLVELKLKPKVFKSSKYFVGAYLKAYKATWQNQRQRRREEKRKNALTDGMDSSPSSNHTTEPESCLSPSSHSSSPILQATSPSEGAVVNAGLCKRNLGTLYEEGEETSLDMTVPKKPKLDDGSSDEDSSDDEESNHGKRSQNTGGDECHTESTKGTSSETSTKVKQTGKPCLLKVNIFVKLINNQLIVEMHQLGGLLGRDGVNQILTYFRNKLQKR
uniref:U6 snRNA m(6)A methyltransferase n=1 Tax=Hirondellea gigas TaxID=1518452 RepID=A0A2P2HZU5_9CRUS